MMEEALVQKSKADRNMTGLAGELFVAAELLKRGLQTSITFGNAMQIERYRCIETGARGNQPTSAGAWHKTTICSKYRE